MANPARNPAKPVRLTDTEIAQILDVARLTFGATVEVLLFGSRTDQFQKGGDIDLLIRLPEEEKQAYTLQHKIRFLAELKSRIGDQKIDVSYDDITKTNPTFLRTIRENAVSLNPK